jgi:hypothetical protein
VISLIVFQASVSDIAGATSQAAESALSAAAHDPALRHSFWLLTQVPTAATTEKFVDALRRLGLYVSSDPTLPEVCGALIEAVDRHVQSSSHRTDLGELAQVSAVESLNAIAGREMHGLFGPTYAAEDTRLALRRLATPSQFGVLARDFFARLTRRYLDYYLSRELPNHIGADSRFPGLADYHDFEEALESHCRETSLIVRDFSADWFSKHTYEGGIDPQKAGNFVHYAFEKIRQELVRRRDADS